MIELILNIQCIHSCWDTWLTVWSEELSVLEEADKRSNDEEYKLRFSNEVDVNSNVVDKLPDVSPYKTK